MPITIHRGTHQIGGCVTEIRSQNTRIIIDMGAELPSAVKQEKPELEIKGVTVGKPDCGGVFISHYHGDHIGMFEKIMPEIPVYMGEVAHSVFLNLYKHLRGKNTERIKAFKTFKPKDKIRVTNEITVTPYFVDHSAYDAYMFLIEAEGKRILHTGDFRAHGWKGKGLFPTLEHYIEHVDVLIIEGTMLSRAGEKIYSEVDLYNDAKKLMRDNRNVFVLCSSTNFDSIASFYKAAQECNRLFVCDSYQRSNLDIVSEAAVSDLYKMEKAKIYWDGREDCIDKMKEMGFCMLVRANGKFDKVLEMFPDSLFIYSMWDGYLEDGAAKNEKIYNFIPKDEHGKLKYLPLHTSGHATTETIIEVCKKLKPQIIIPIHGEKPERFKEFELTGCEIRVLEDHQTVTV